MAIYEGVKHGVEHEGVMINSQNVRGIEGEGKKGRVATLFRNCSCMPIEKEGSFSLTIVSFIQCLTSLKFKEWGLPSFANG